MKHYLAQWKLYWTNLPFSMYIVFFFFEAVGSIAYILQVQEYLVSINISLFSLPPFRSYIYYYGLSIGPIIDILYFFLGSLILCVITKGFKLNSNLSQIRLIMIWSWVIPFSLSNLFSGLLAWLLHGFGRFTWIRNFDVIFAILLLIWKIIMFIFGVKEINGKYGTRVSAIYFFSLILVKLLSVQSLIDDFVSGNQP